MKRGRRYWWKKDDGTRHEVEIFNAPGWAFPASQIPVDKESDKSILVKVMAGVHAGMFAIVDPAHLKPLDD